ncbi:hypothetical protein HGRIS_009867 [Hohenbuehelia grisea]|uniref:Chromatin target of PRMT1 protein C-terminal domain-containing protein n=1 Tax=Hohenbuehelia grisea TaxID=104357 RepID=A0ABR3J2V1_9AGAR
MDNSPDGVAPEVIEDNTLSYDDNVSYEDQIPAAESTAALANRIGTTKVYLLSESRSLSGKRKRDEDEAAANGNDDDEDIDMDEDSSRRANALLFRGSPISHLPTSRLFAYATHFDAQPMGLEWIDDSTCIFVFTSAAAARDAYRLLQKSKTDILDDDGYVTAKPIPVDLWPPEERITSSLGQAEGLKGTLEMRWARIDDVKKKGAKKESEFYRKHGTSAGKEVHGERIENGREEDTRKRRRGEDREPVDEQALRARLDDDLDRFLAEDGDNTSEDASLPVDEPTSRMRSDYIANDGRTLLERTSVLRAHPDGLASRITAPLPRRARGGRRNDPPWDSSDADSGRDGDGQDRRRRGGRNRGRTRRDNTAMEAQTHKRPRKTQQELDDELDAFLNQDN